MFDLITTPMDRFLPIARLKGSMPKTEMPDKRTSKILEPLYPQKADAPSKLTKLRLKARYSMASPWPTIDNDGYRSLLPVGETISITTTATHVTT